MFLGLVGVLGAWVTPQYGSRPSSSRSWLFPPKEVISSQSLQFHVIKFKRLRTTYGLGHRPSYGLRDCMFAEDAITDVFSILSSMLRLENL